MPLVYAPSIREVCGPVVCVFCNEKASIVKTTDDGSKGEYSLYHASCVHCGARGPSARTETGAKRLWNKVARK